MPWLQGFAMNRAVVDRYLDILIEALMTYRSTVKHRATIDQAECHYRAARDMVHRPMREAQIAPALREIEAGDRCLYRAGLSPEHFLRRMRDDWRKARGER